MKIAYTGLDLPEGKVKYQDPVFIDLAEKFQPKKLSPFYFELLEDDYEAASAIAIASESVVDLLILDFEKVEGRLARTEDPTEKGVLERSLAQLEAEQPVCDLSLDASERAIINGIGLLSFKPTVVVEDLSLDTNAVCQAALEKAGMMFFYTAGKQEVHAWLVEKDADAVTCAGKIHTDLARGFIKAELVSYEDMMAVHSMQDARSKGLTKLVDHDYTIPQNSILDIRFNV